MKKVLMICGAAVFGMATFVHAQDLDTASTDYNTQPPVEQQDQSTLPTEDQPTLDQPTQDPNLNEPTQDPTLDQPTHQPPVQDPALDRPTEDPALDQPTQDQPLDDGTNAIPQGQSRESDQPTEDQTDQSTDPSIDPSTSTDPSMERPGEITPVEGKQGPNGEAVFMENGKYYYMDEAGEKKKIKKSELNDKTQ